MKKLFIVLSVAAGLIACEKKVKLDTDMQKASYAIGQQIGQNLKAQNIDADADVLGASIKEAMKGDKSRMKPEEMQQAMMKLQEAVIAKQKEAGEKNKKTGQEFLDKNKTQAGVKTTASGLQYQVLTEGTGKTPAASDTVKAHYKGTLIDGKVFDSSYDRGQPAEFPVSGVIPGWTEALQMMKVGSKWKLFIPAELAYGQQSPPGIPSNSVLIFEVELLDVIAGTAPKKK